MSYHPLKPSLVLLIACALAFVWTPPTSARPLTIKSKTSLTLSVSRMGSQRFVDLALTDDGGTAIPGATVQLLFSGLGQLKVTTDASGRLSLSRRWLNGRGLTVRDREYVVKAHFAGNLKHGASNIVQRLNFGRHPVKLEFVDLQRRVDIDSDKLLLSVRLTSRDIGLAAQHLTLTLQRGKSFKATTDAGGNATFVVLRSGFPRPGRHLISARFEGSSDHSPAETTEYVAFVSRTRLSLTVRVTFPDDKEKRALHAEGRLLLRNRPLAGKAITLSDRGQRLLQTTSDRNGRYAIVLKHKRLPTGRLKLQSDYRSTDSSVISARSRVVSVFVPAFPAIPLRYYLLPLALLIPVLLMLGIRRLPWKRLRELARRLRKRPEHEKAVVHRILNHPVVEPVPLPPRHIEAPLALDSIVGQVHDVEYHRPLGGAEVVIRDANDQPIARAKAGPAGWFRFDGLPHGRHTLVISQRFFMAERITLRIPHRGQFSGFRVNLLPIRLKILETYRSLLDGTYPATQIWGIHTPREALRLLMDRMPRGHGELKEFTDQFEHLYYGDEQPDQEHLQKFSAMTSELTERNR